MKVTEAPKALLGRIFSPCRLTLAEQNFRREELLKTHPLTNAGLWFATIVDRGFIKVGEIDTIIEAYNLHRDAFPDDDVPLSALFQIAHLQNPPKDDIYKRVCFNYDATFDVKERFSQAVRELKEGERKIVDGNDFWSVKMWIEQDFRRLLSGGIEIKDVFNKATNTTETLYCLMPYSSSTFFGNYSDLKNVYRRAVYLLEPDELFKASKPSQFSSNDLYYSPTISKCREALPPDTKTSFLLR